MSKVILNISYLYALYHSLYVISSLPIVTLPTNLSNRKARLKSDKTIQTCNYFTATKYLLNLHLNKVPYLHYVNWK